MKKRAIVFLLAVVLGLAAFSGCGEKKDVPTSSASGESSITASGEIDKNQTAEINLYTYYADASKPTVDRVLEELKKIYPNVTINIEHRTDSDGQVLKTRASVGELPDIFETEGQLADIFTEAKYIEPMDDIIEKSGIFDQFIDGAFDGKAAADGKYYVLTPNSMEMAQLFYNKEVFGKLNLDPPTNFEEFKIVVSKLSENGIIPLALFGQQKWPGLQLMDMAIIGQGQIEGLGALEDGKHSITEPEFYEAAKRIEELVQLGLIGKGALNTNASQAFEQLQTGQGGMLINGAWYFRDAKEYGENIDSFDYNPFADADKTEDLRWNRSGGAPASGGYAVNPDGKHVELSTYILMDFLRLRNIVEVEDYGQIKLVKENVEPKDPRAEGYQKYVDTVEQVESMTTYEWGLNNQELIVALEDTTEMLLTGNLTAEAYIESLDGQLSAIYG